MIKPIDMSVLPNDFLLQVESVNQHGLTVWNYQKVANDNRHKLKEYRPALNHWHHNDGTMTLPDGLVVEVQSFGSKYIGIIKNGDFLELPDLDPCHASGLDQFKVDNDGYTTKELEIIAVKILGVTAEYGPQLGMEVIEP